MRVRKAAYEQMAAQRMATNGKSGKEPMSSDDLSLQKA